MSLNSIQPQLSSLKTCQSDISTGMDIVSEVALDLVEAQATDDSPGLKKLEQMMLDCARLDREITCFVESVEEIIVQSQMLMLKDTVKWSPSGTASGNPLQQVNQTASGSVEEELDEDIAVTQSQMNFTCPLTQIEMVNPVKNKKCQHYYDHEAILSFIKTRQSNKKKCRCPVVGCGNSDVKASDLELDLVMRRTIQNHKRQSAKS